VLPGLALLSFNVTLVPGPTFTLQILELTPEALSYGRAAAMVTFRADTCDKCKSANPISYRVEPEEAWKAVVLNRWRRLCPRCLTDVPIRCMMFRVKSNESGTPRGVAGVPDRHAGGNGRDLGALRQGIRPQNRTQRAQG
jgi:hypothetical protein